MRVRHDTRWVIVQGDNLFVGQYQRRKDAIKDHVMSLFTYPRTPTADEIARHWGECQKIGHRCIKAVISWNPRP